MKWYLVIYFLVNGIWVEGDPADGWGRREMASEETCRAARQRASAVLRAEGRDGKARWDCILAAAEKTETAE
jgi:hypothetical protein